MIYRTSIALFIGVFLLFGCSNEERSKKPVKLSEEMKDFTSMLNGSYEGITKAMEKHAEIEIIDDDITRLDLEKPVITDVKTENEYQRCYTMEANIGVTTKTFVLCWEHGKIYSVEDLGFKE